MAFGDNPKRSRGRMRLPIKGYLCAKAVVDSHRTSTRLQMSSSGGVDKGWTASNDEDVSLARTLSIW